MAVEPIFQSFASRPKAQSTRRPVVGLHALVRDQLSIATWILIGALIQATAATFLPYRNIVMMLPVVLVLGWKMLRAMLICCGVLRNPYMADVILERTTPIFPSEKDGTQSISSSSSPGNTAVCAILLGVRCNHALGMFGPGFRQVGEWFSQMVAELDASASEHGFLGSNSWTSSSDRFTGNETASILYFENEHYLHAYAHGPLHTQTMRWWRENEHRMPHVGIMHEVFACAKNGWEGVYVNYHPTGLGATSKEMVTVNGRSAWINPLVRMKGKLMYSKGRMGRAYNDGAEWTAFGDTFPEEWKTPM